MAWDEAYGPHGRNRGEEDLAAVGLGGGVFEGNLFIGRRGMGAGEPVPQTVDIPLRGDIVDGDLAFALWHMGVVPAAQVGPGAPQVIEGVRRLAQRINMTPAVVRVEANVLKVPAQLAEKIKTAYQALEGMDRQALAQLRQRLQQERVQQGGAVPPGAPGQPVPARGPGDGLLPQIDVINNKWVKWAAVGGGALAVGGLAWWWMRRGKPVKNRRRRRRK